MAKLKTKGAELEYTVEGKGEPILLVHGGIIADGMSPLLRQRALMQSYRLISFHRRGYGASSRTSAPFTISDQAKDCLAVMQELGVSRAHVVGHSFGGIIALQLALEANDKVASLTLIEPSLLGFIPSSPMIAGVFEALGKLYQSGDKAGLVHNWLLPISGQDYRGAFDGVLPTGWYERAVADIDTPMQVELPALQSWGFNLADARRIEQPVLSIIGAAHQMAFANEVDELLHTWFPHARTLEVPGALHWPQLTDPRAVAQGLAQFLARSYQL